MELVFGGGAAALLIAFNLVFARRFRVTLDALHCWFIWLVVEGAQGALAAFAVELVAGDATRVNGPALWMAAGAFAPSVIRRLQYGGPDDRFAFDLQDLFDRLRVPLEKKIDSSSAQAQAHADNKLVDELMAKGVTPDRIADDLLSVIRARKVLQTNWRDADYIRETAARDDSVRTRIRLLVEKARELDILRTVKRLARRSAVGARSGGSTGPAAR